MQHIRRFLTWLRHTGPVEWLSGTWVWPFLIPVTEVPDRPDPVKQPGLTAYIRSFLWMRLCIGALGFLLPIVLILDHWLWHENPFFRGSLSAYYYSGFREIFVGFIGAIGGFLLVYKIAERSLDNTLSIFAGLSAVLIPFFPTNQPCYIKSLDPLHACHPGVNAIDGQHVPLTMLQSRWGETTVATIHYTASVLFLIFLMFIVACFSVREYKRPKRVGQHLPSRFWGSLHLTSALVMAGTLVWLALAHFLDWGPDNALLIGEWICAWAFSIAWLSKGAEWDVLLGTPRPIRE